MKNANIEPFERHTVRYDEWFDAHPELYEWELEALKSLMPPVESSIEIGVGSGRFAAPLGIKSGLEPSPAMASIARERGIEIVEGVAESIPLPDGSFDLVLMVTTICFVNDPAAAMKEIYRVLRYDGYLLMGFVDAHSDLGRLYEKSRSKSDFYKSAVFYSAGDIVKMAQKAGFSECMSVQTLFGSDLDHMEGGVKRGYGEGAFVVIRCKKTESAAAVNSQER